MALPLKHLDEICGYFDSGGPGGREIFHARIHEGALEAGFLLKQVAQAVGWEIARVLQLALDQLKPAAEVDPAQGPDRAFEALWAHLFVIFQ